MTEDIIVRRALVEDIPALADLAARSFRDAFEADNNAKDIEDYVSSSLTIERIRNEFIDAGNIFLIACRGDHTAPIGYAKLCTTSEDLSINDQNRIEIERIYADKAEIGRGVGAALMRTCLDMAEDLKCQTIWLGVWERNERAIPFYERWGFATVGVRQFALGSELQKDKVMARRLA
jgi:ribosomal protein S18 acetylase RimI-like enzyme